jgi:hypothetical protein
MMIVLIEAGAGCWERLQSNTADRQMKKPDHAVSKSFCKRILNFDIPFIQALSYLNFTLCRLTLLS